MLLRHKKNFDAMLQDIISMIIDIPFIFQQQVQSG